MLTIAFGVTVITYVINGVNLQYTDNQAIMFRYKDKYRSDFTVKKYEPIDIVLDNFFAVHGWCLDLHYTGPESEFVKHIHFNGSSDAVIHVPNVTDEMITKWWCVVLRPYQLETKAYVFRESNYTAYNIAFNLHSNDTSRTSRVLDPTDYNSIYFTLGAIVLTIIFFWVAIIFLRKRDQPKTEFQIQRPNPDRFYLNLEIFRREYERELQAEPEYEEID